MNRRGFLTAGGALLVAAPAIVRASSLMPVRDRPVARLIGVDLGKNPDKAFYTVMKQLRSGVYEVITTSDTFPLYIDFSHVGRELRLSEHQNCFKVGDVVTWRD